MSFLGGLKSGKRLEWDSDAMRKMTWPEAQEYAESLGDGWRLPTVEELVSQWRYETGSAKSAGWNPDWYWAAARHSKNPSMVWAVHFGDGSVDRSHKLSPFRVRCVRG